MNPIITWKMILSGKVSFCCYVKLNIKWLSIDPRKKLPQTHLLCCAWVCSDKRYLLWTITNYVCIVSRILGVSTKELQDQFDVELPDNLRKPPSYARNFLEFCSYKALQLAITRPNYLNDKEFCRLTFDMMIAWEAPGVDAPSADMDLIDEVIWDWSFFS